MAASKFTLTPIQEALTAALNSGSAQRLGDVHYRPKHQEYWYSGVDGAWQSISPTNRSVVTSLGPPVDPRVIRLISWNIDILVGFAEERMQAALQYLNQLVSSTPPCIAIIVFLQEMGQSDLEQIRDSNPHYGTTTLVDRRLKIKDVFRVPWVSKFDRDGLFVDITLSDPKSPGEDVKVLRLCNTHLESLVADPPIRPLQLAAAAEYLTETEVACALLAGDLNAIQPFDRTLHTKNNLKDAYLELGGQEDSDDGYTWGYQVPQWMRDKFGCSRMDKVLLRGEVQPSKFERIGMGMKVAEDVLENVEKEIDGGWVTDHYGVMGDFELTGGWQLQG